MISTPHQLNNSDSALIKMASHFIRHFGDAWRRLATDSSSDYPLTEREADTVESLVDTYTQLECSRKKEVEDWLREVESSQKEMSVTIHILTGKMEARFLGNTYYTIHTAFPNVDLMLRHSGIIANHPLRDRHYNGFYFLSIQEGALEIKRCEKEEDIPSGALAFSNQLLNR